MKKLLFLSNELLNPEVQKMMQLPLTFVAFSMVSGKLYSHFRSQSNFLITDYTDQTWGNSKVYGALFICKDFDFYSAILDAYHVCSMSTMLRNHNLDIQHRVDVETTLIHFETLDDLSRLKYREGEHIIAQTYVGNPKHPKISSRFHSTVSYRIVDGIDSDNFKKLFEEVAHEGNIPNIT